MQSSSKKLVVVCFGDSYTSGYHSMGRKADPYCRKLGELLFEAGIENSCLEYGVPGEISWSMTKRVGQLIEMKAKPNVFIALGGTNDLGGMASAKEIFNNMEHVVKTALKMSDRVILMTIPSFPNLEKFKDLEPKRIEANDMIKKIEIENVRVVDLAANILPQDKEIWDKDGLHPNKAGYEKFAHVIFDTVGKEYFV